MMGGWGSYNPSGTSLKLERDSSGRLHRRPFNNIPTMWLPHVGWHTWRPGTASSRESWLWLTQGLKTSRPFSPRHGPRRRGTYLVSIQERIHEPRARVLWWGREEGRISLAGAHTLLCNASAVPPAWDPPQISPTCPGAGSCEDPQCLCAPALALLSPVHPQLSRLHGTESHGGGQVGLPGSPVSEPAPSCLGAGALPTFLDLLFLDLLRAHLVGFRLLVGAQLLHVLLLLPLGLIQVPLVGAAEGLSQPRGRGGRPPRPTPHLPTAPSLEVNPAPRPAVRGTFLPQTLAFKSLSQLSEGRLPSPGWAGLPHPFCLVKSHLEGANWWCVLFPIFLQL